MNADFTDLIEAQKALCADQSAGFAPCEPTSITGFASETCGLLPINGLRHRPTETTNGWYIWCGEQFSTDPDFFAPMHTSDLYENVPEIAQFLGLPPGYRFVIGEETIDVWLDASLIEA